MESHSLCDDGVVLNDDLSNLLLGGILTRWLIEESMLRVLLASYMVDVLASDGVEGDFLIKQSWAMMRVGVQTSKWGLMESVAQSF